MTRVHVVPLSDEVRESDVERFFRGYGRIREVFIKRDFAFVVRCLLLYGLTRRLCLCAGVRRPTRCRRRYS